MKLTYYGCSGCGVVSTLASAFTPFGNGRWCAECMEKKKLAYLNRL